MRGPSYDRPRTASGWPSSAAYASWPTPADSTPPAWPTRLREVAQGLGLDPVIAHVEGDDVRDLLQDLGLGEGVLTANAYLGGFGIAAALGAGADVVVTGRVTDASLVVGPAAAHHGWASDDHDALAGAVVAGHVLECGTQATGGNFSGFAALPEGARSRPLGFPLAEVAADGSSVITKHDHTGGAVTVDTVTAQLLYEIQSTRYLGPDVTADLASIELSQDGPDRVAVRGVRGAPPPKQLKVCVNELGGWRNSVELVLTGLDVEAKAGWAREQLTAALDPAPATVDWSPVVAPPADAATEESASVLLRCTVQDPSADVVGRPFTAAAVELALASYPGFTMTAPPGPATPYGICRAEYVDRSAVSHTVVHADGRREPVPDPPTAPHPSEDRTGTRPSPYPHPTDTLTRRMPLGTLRPRPLGRQGRRRQPRPLGAPRRPGGQVRRPRRVALQADHPPEGARAGAGGGRPRRRRVPAAQPRRRQRRAARAARPRRRRLDPVRPAGQGPGRVGPVAAGLDPGGSPLMEVDHRDALKATAAEFVRREVVPHLDAWEEAGEVPRELHASAAKQGLLGVSFPESVGGEGGDLLDSIAVMEGCFEAGASSGLMAALFTGGIALPHIASSGNADLVDRFVRPTLAGELIGSLAVTEPGGGSDVAQLRTTARRDGDHFVVDGTKTFITSGVRADFVTAAVRTGGPGHAGISLLVIEKGTPGFTVDRALSKMGWHCSDTAELGFAGCRVPVGNLVGEQDSGFARIADQFVVERIALAVHGYGIAARSLELTAAHCRERETFGRPLVSEPGRPPHPGGDAAPGRGRADLHPRGGAAPRRGGVRDRRGVPGQADRHRLRDVRL